MERKGIPPTEVEKRISLANRAFPDALDEHYESLVPNLVLPDEQDR